MSCVPPAYGLMSFPLPRHDLMGRMMRTPTRISQSTDAIPKSNRTHQNTEFKHQQEPLCLERPPPPLPLPLVPFSHPCPPLPRQPQRPPLRVRKPSRAPGPCQIPTSLIPIPGAARQNPSSPPLDELGMTDSTPPTSPLVPCPTTCAPPSRLH